MSDDEPGWDEASLAAHGKALREEPRVRHFPYLGWSVFLYPLDLFEARGVARMVLGTFSGFEPDEVLELPARRLVAEDGEPERTWWVFAVPAAAVRRQWKKDRGPSPHG